MSPSPIDPSRYVNPFGIPGAPRRDDVPLRPWFNPDHEDHYVNVDDTDKAFHRFCEELGDPSAIRETGWLVTVTGHEGCGKTSVINRCANRLRESLREAGVDALICDLTPEADDGITAEEKVRQVSQALAGKVGPRLEEGDQEALKEHADDLKRTLRRISESVDDDTAVIVLTPPCELFSEMQRYHSAVRKKIVVFGEGGAGIGHECRERLGTGKGAEGNETMVLHLQVGSLQHGNGKTLTEARVKGDDRGVRFPALNPDAPDRLVALRLDGEEVTSIRFVQRLLYNTYEHFRHHDWPSDGVVEYSHLVEQLVRMAKLS